MSAERRFRRAEPGTRLWTPVAAVAAKLTAVAVLAGAAVVMVACTHRVTLVDDGVARDLPDHARTVRGLLRDAGLRLGPHDTVRPAGPAAPGDRVVVGRGRPVTLTLDGKITKRWTTDRTVSALVASLGLDPGAVRVGSDTGGGLPRSGADVIVRTRKAVTLVADGDSTQLRTYAATVGDLLAERHITLGPDTEADPPAGTSLAGVDTVQVYRVTVRHATETVTSPAPLRAEESADLFTGQQQVMSPGRAGVVRSEVEYVYRDGELLRRQVLSSTVLAVPLPKVVAHGTKPYPADGGGLNWTALAACESGGNPRASAPGGYYGLYQFSPSTWSSLGGSGLPSEATPQEQTYRAMILYRRSGRGQWPTCGGHL